MLRSEHRILTTHVGSLVRPPALLERMRARSRGEEVSEVEYNGTMRDAVGQIVREQAETGLDVISDGECGKAISWAQYALERLSGFERRPFRGGDNPFERGADRARFPDFYREYDASVQGTTVSDSVCIGPIAYVGQAAVQRDIENFRSALATHPAVEGFLPVAAPSSVIPDRINEYYPNDEACLEAIAEAMRTEYRAIVDSGFLLQLDDARAAVTFDRMVPPASFAEYRSWVARHVEVLNHALEGLPEDRIRYHVCWGSWPGPHTSDVPLGEIVDLILRVKAGAYLIEGANPRHEHEWTVWERVKLPPGKILAPGVISHATNIVEHPELIAQRIMRYATLVGRENVMASTDCGFAQGPFLRRVHPSIQWAKLQSLVEGARLATKKLWH